MEKVGPGRSMSAEEMRSAVRSIEHRERYVALLQCARRSKTLQGERRRTIRKRNMSADMQRRLGFEVVAPRLRWDREDERGRSGEDLPRASVVGISNPLDIRRTTEPNIAHALRLDLARRHDMDSRTPKRSFASPIPGVELEP